MANNSRSSWASIGGDDWKGWMIQRLTSIPEPDLTFGGSEKAREAGLERNVSNTTSGSIEKAQEPHETKDLSFLAIIATGWNITSSWASMGATLAIGITAGGPVTLIYGIMLIFILGGASALSMAEIAAVYPTAGGQYHWTSILAPSKSSGRALSYICGALNMFAWIANAASVMTAAPQILLSLAAFWIPGYEPATLHVFLIYQSLNLFFIVYNVFLIKRMAWIQNVGFFLSLGGFLVITVTCLALSNPKQSSEFVWTTFQNKSGWSSNAIVFLTGLVNANFIYSGLDGAIHLAEECANPGVAVPAALISTTVIGFVTALTFAVAMMYSFSDFDGVLKAHFPLFEIWVQATRSPIVSTIFLIVFVSTTLVAIPAVQQTASRLTQSLARDAALPAALAREHRGAAVWALLVNGAVVFALGLVYLASSTAFNAVVSVAVVLTQLSFALPAALLVRRRALLGLAQALPPAPPGRFRMPGWAGLLANLLTLVMAVVAVVFYELPVELPVTPTNMNYASAVIGMMGLLTAANWIGHASRQYNGPTLEMEK